MPPLQTRKGGDGTHEILVYGFMDSDMAEAFAREVAAHQDSKVINARINCVGGGVYNGIAMYNTVRNSKVPIDMYIDGICASMATAFIMAGRKRYMSKYARIMAHKPSCAAVGNSDELRANADEMDALEAIMNDMFQECMGMPQAEVQAKFLNGKDNFFSATAAKAAGLVNGVYDGPDVDITAAMDDVNKVYAVFEAALSASLPEGSSQINDNLNFENMKQISLALYGEICAKIGITASADEATFAQAVKKLSEKAKNYETTKALLVEKEGELDTFKKDVVKKEVTAMLKASHDGQKISTEQRNIFAADYAENPSGLQKVLATMGAFVSVNSQFLQREKGQYPAEVVALMNKGYTALMDSGEMEMLNELNPEACAEVREAYLESKRKK